MVLRPCYCWSKLRCAVNVKHTLDFVALLLRPREVQHTRLLCLPLSPGVWPNSCSVSWWWHPTISSSVFTLFPLPSVFPRPGSFLMSQLFAPGGQSTGASASASVLPMNIQDWFSWGLTGFIFLLYKGLSRVFTTPKLKSINSSVLSLPYGPTLTSIYDYWKNHSLD